MDIVIKIFFSGYFFFAMGAFIFLWVKTWFVLNKHKPADSLVSNIRNALFAFPHLYLIYCGLSFFEFNKIYFPFIFAWIIINIIKNMLNSRHTYSYATYCQWETIMYIPGIIYIFQH